MAVEFLQAREDLTLLVNTRMTARLDGTAHLSEEQRVAQRMGDDVFPKNEGIE